MSDLDFSEAYSRLKVENEFMCKRNFDVNTWDCKSCPYFYKGGISGAVSMCLKKEIRDWTLYRIEVENEQCI